MDSLTSNQKKNKKVYKRPTLHFPRNSNVAKLSAFYPSSPTMTDHIIDPDVYTKAGSIKKSYFRDVYPAVDPTRADISQAGKVTIITGAGNWGRMSAIVPSYTSVH